MIKVATLNLCLGLRNKKDLVKNIMVENNIDILALQETELDANCDVTLMSIPSWLLF